MHPDNREGLQKLIGSDYTLQWIIGHGGMSTVWLADDTVADREVAIKVLKPEFSSNEEFLTRFQNEAIAAEGITSDNVVATYDYREVTTEAGYTVCFIVMEYIRGESLADMIAREGKLDEPLALDVVEQAAHGLAVIHGMGLVHRDIKPGNLMVTQNGTVKITDFGIAKAAAAVPLTRTGMVVGTAQYVSPEQAQGKKVTAATDVYSLGVVGYELLAGERPFTGDSSVSVALAHVNNEPPALSTTTSAPARELIEIAMRKDPAARFANGNELALAVQAVREGKRPPQQASAAMNRVATEPSPTAATQQLAAVAQPTTLHPEVARKQPEGLVERRPAVVPANVGPRPAKKKRSPLPWVLLALLALGGAGALGWALTSGPLAGDDSPEPATTSPEVVTEYVTSTEETPTSSSEPGRRQAPQVPQGTRQAPATQAPQNSGGNVPAPTQGGGQQGTYAPQQQPQQPQQEQPAPQPEAPAPTQVDPPQPSPVQPAPTGGQTQAPAPDLPPAPEVPEVPNVPEAPAEVAPEVAPAPQASPASPPGGANGLGTMPETGAGAPTMMIFDTPAGGA